jgi:hypothetical protein
VYVCYVYVCYVYVGYVYVCYVYVRASAESLSGVTSIVEHTAADIHLIHQQTVICTHTTYTITTSAGCK